MDAIWIKPQINFHLMPAIGTWIKAKYDKVKTRGEMIDFIHHCLDEADISANPVRQEWYSKVASVLYSWTTGKAYENNADILID